MNQAFIRKISVTLQRGGGRSADEARGMCQTTDHKTKLREAGYCNVNFEVYRCMCQ